MACGLTTGISRNCKEGLGGVKKVWIFTFVKYSRSQLVRTGLTLTEFPPTVVYEYKVLDGATVTQTHNEDDGGKYYEQSINFKIPNVGDKFKLSELMKKDVRIIYQDNNGLFRMLGAYNGLYCDSIDFITGGGKVDFNGVDITFRGNEKEEALFLDELLIPDISLENNYIFMDGNNYIFMDGNNFIFN